MHLKFFLEILLLCVISSRYSVFTYQHQHQHHDHHHSGEQHLAESQSVLDPKGHLLLKWQVNYATKRIRFILELSHKASIFSWFALGFSDRGEMENSDVCLLWCDYKEHDHFEDMHADTCTKLARDEKQNCDNYRIDSINRTLSFERAFDTCDDDDYVIEDGTVHVIWARGTDKLFSSRGLCLNCTAAEDRGFIRVRLFTPPAVPKPEGNELRLTNKDVKVPGSDTTYWCHVMKLPDYVTRTPHHVVRFESAITRGNEGLVHHMEVFYCDAPPDQDIPLYEGNCFDKRRPADTKLCSKVKAAWAMGARPFTYPAEAGLPLGGPKANKYIMLEVHYNNPQLREDWVDSSGMVLLLTSHRRRYDAAIMELGLEYTDKMAIPGRQKHFPLSGYCVPQCTGVGLPSDGITVFGSQLHTHLTGVAVWTRHARHGIEMPPLNVDRHYSTHFQEIRILRRPVQVLPGDYLETTCIYNTEDKANATIGGHAITDEMCVNYIHYYPATELEVCKSSVSSAAMDRYFEFEKRWDNVPMSLPTSPREKYLSIEPWSPLRVEALHKLYTESTISMQCNRSDGHRFQGYWEGLPIPTIRVPLPVEPRVCPHM